MEAVVETLGASQITIGYGQTEASPIITLTSVDDPIEVRVGTVGRPIPGVEVRLVDPVTRPGGRRPARPASSASAGHCVMAGYYKTPEATARVIDADGWLYTGDLARRRDDGNYRIVGRSKELIIRGGENIYPPEVEEFLHHHPAVAEVAVVGLPDARVRRGRLRLGRPPRRCAPDRGRAPRLLPRPDRPLQDPALHPRRRPAAQDRHRQGPQARPPRTRDRGAWTRGVGRDPDGLRVFWVRSDHG